MRQAGLAISCGSFSSHAHQQPQADTQGHAKYPPRRPASAPTTPVQVPSGVAAAPDVLQLFEQRELFQFLERQVQKQRDTPLQDQKRIGKSVVNVLG